ncbi:MAG TPA: class I SAM-dependent methyltransferase [Chthoniobacterales bacterium]
MKQQTLIDYYSRRAHEYEHVYHKPERQADLLRLKAHLRCLLKGRDVFELACGTGFWTAAIADGVESILAIDVSKEVLDIARSKNLDSARVSFARGDALNLTGLEGTFTAGFAAFWWSHVPVAKLAPFLEGFHSVLLPGARVTFADNRFVAGSSTPIYRTDETGNTYQLRHLQDGSSYEVLKNFPTAGPLFDAVRPYSDTVDLVEFDYFWCLTYDLKRV